MVSMMFYILNDIIVIIITIVINTILTKEKTTTTIAIFVVIVVIVIKIMKITMKVVNVATVIPNLAHPRCRLLKMVILISALAMITKVFHLQFINKTSNQSKL